jgi:hypothetical protein
MHAMLARPGAWLPIAVAAAAAGAAAAAPPTQHLLPRPPYRMMSFAYNTTAGGPQCTRDSHRRWSCNASAPPDKTAVPVDTLYPPNTYNLLNPGFCYPNSNTTERTTGVQSDWLDKRGVACMAWGHCWNKKFPNTTNDSTVIASFRQVIVGAADEGATAVGLDECGDLSGPHWGHIPGDIPGMKKMTLAAEGFRQGKAARPHLFVAAWNPGSSAEADGIFSGLMKDGTFDLVWLLPSASPRPPPHSTRTHSTRTHNTHTHID